MSQGQTPPGAPALDVGQILSEAWALLMKDIGLYIGATLVQVAIVVVTCGLGALLWAPLFGGIIIMGFKSMKGLPLAFEDAFAGFKLFVPLLLLSLVSLILITIGLVLCILPGIYLALAWGFAPHLVIDRKMEFWPAMELSMSTVNQNFVPVLVVFLVLAIINSLGGTVVLGFVLTQPLFMLGMTVAYTKLFGMQPGPPV